MTWTAEARERSLEKVEKCCQECGERYWIIRVASTKSKRCPGCQDAFEVENKKLIRKKHQEARGQGRGARLDKMTCYRIVRDPEGSWGYCTELTIQEVKVLLKLRYLAVGTVLEAKGVRDVVRKDDWGHLRLVPMSISVDSRNICAIVKV